MWNKKVNWNSKVSRNLCWCLGLMIVMLSSCGTKKSLPKKVENPAEITTPMEPTVGAKATATAIEAFELANLDFRTFSGKAKANLEINDTKKDVTLNIRIAKDYKIWISVTANLGIEVARVLITPDSVQVMNKLYGEYMAKPFSYIHTYTSSNLTFANIQDILLGNVSANLLHTDQLQLASSTEATQVIGKKADLTYIYTINSANKAVQLRMSEGARRQTLEVGYGTFISSAGYLFPQLLKLRVLGEKSSMVVDIDYSRVQFDDVIETPFNIPSKYKLIN